VFLGVADVGLSVSESGSVLPFKIFFAGTLSHIVMWVLSGKDRMLFDGASVAPLCF